MFSKSLQSGSMLDRQELRRLAAAALVEDVGRGDITSEAVVPRDALAQGEFTYKQSAVVCGLPVAKMVFRVTDPSLRFAVKVEEGRRVKPGTVVAVVSGRARSILKAERVALNFMQRLSGIATLTREFVSRVRGTRAKILDTRKTTPGLRALEKYAVRIGGGANHRMSLDDAALIKDNHLTFDGDLETAVRELRRRGRWVEIEAAGFEQVKRFVALDVNALMLDNFPIPLMKKAVAYIRRHKPRAIIEASGGVNLKTVGAIAKTGVDWISVGALTHSVPAVDISLELRPRGSA